MADRIKILIQKRTSLKSQLTSLNNILDKGQTNNTALKLRTTRVTELFHAFEEYNNELVILDPDNGHEDEYAHLQDRYYTLAAKVEDIVRASDCTDTSIRVSPNDNGSEGHVSAITPSKRRIKLPEASLPRFDGRFENWLSFKHTFHDMIGSQTDMSELDKLQYLKSSLMGEAANKIKIFESNHVNYSKAWELLERSYEVKRILISRHLTAIHNLPVLERETTSGLTKLADDAQQHVASLKTLGVSVGSEVIVHVIESRLPRSTSERWEAQLDRDEYPTDERMYEFLYKSAVFASRREETNKREAVKVHGENATKRRRTSYPASRALMLNTSRDCPVCNMKRHPLYCCEKFKRLPVRSRIDEVRKANLCYICMRSHKGIVCKFNNCTICQKRHNTLLHMDNYSYTKKADTSKPTTFPVERLAGATNDKASSLATIPISTPHLMTSAIVHIRDKEHKPVRFRALLDTCATANFITESVVKRLGLRVTPQSLPISAINGMNTESKGIVQVTIQSVQDNFSRELVCLTIPMIANSIPSEVFPRDTIKIPSNVRLADPEFHVPRAVDLLIGSGASLSLFAVGQINLSRDGNDLYLQKTRLGWIIAGGATAQTKPKSAAYYLTRLEDLVQKFWTIEEVTTSKSRSEEELECEAHFIKTVARDHSGQYIVRLPFQNTNKRLGESRNMAFKRLISLERKFNADAILKNEYSRVIEEYIKLGHLNRVTDIDDDGYYMPHHAVMKHSSSTTKLRIVFDASAKTSNGLALNDLLIVGPTIQNKLTSHLIRFRTYNYVITADIEKMYRQVWLHENDRRFQRVLWRRNGNVETFQLNTLAFGVSASPFLAIRTVKQLADDERKTFPRAAEIIESHLYVDDLITGAKSIKEARALRGEITALLARGGFAMRQWASNDLRVISDLNSEAVHAKYNLSVDRTLKTLGVMWDTDKDQIFYITNPVKDALRVTKRNVLSEIAKIYDPLGLLGPVILHTKKLMQNLWQSGLQWDESVPQSIHTEWSKFRKQWELISQISVERKIFVDDYRNIQLHGFCDASNVGYGACIYIRSSGPRGNAVRLLCAKSRVAPLKTVTIPRLELCGALVLAQLYLEVVGTLNVVLNKTVFWCDSTIVLHWLKTAPHLLKTYVANRVVQIQEITGSHEWRHIKTSENPADAISRGQLPRDLLSNQIWFTGPSWLINEDHAWPNETIPINEIPELKGDVCLTTTHHDFDIFDKYSSYTMLLRVVAYCLRFRNANKYSGSLIAEEINKAEIRLLKLVQASRFVDEIKRLTNASIRKGDFANLNPFLDDHGLIRVGGRLQKSDISFAQKHPILLPSRHSVTDSIIREIHKKYHHTGIQTTLCLIRRKFWLTDGRNQVRKIVRACTRCFRFNTNTTEYKMGNLPAPRVRQEPPFSNTGVDFCGPFYIKEKRFRNRARIKVYVCVFVCMSIKAIHLEVVSDLTSDGFLAALRRFTARRGLPGHIYSDNGTNFVGANNQLRELYVLLNSREHKELVHKFASDHRITWHFIPPGAPHFGGLWESSVKMFKHHFKRVVGESLFTFEELNTFVTEVEGILNSRPIISISSDPNDLLVLTPAHYLIGRPLTTLPEGDLTNVADNRLSTWQHLTKLRQDFWKRWRLEYLNELQTRHKWVKDGPKFEVGTVVLVKDKALPCAQWRLGRITQLHPGDDGIARSLTVKTSSGEIKRSTKSLCPLPIR